MGILAHVYRISIRYFFGNIDLSIKKAIKQKVIKRITHFSLKEERRENSRRFFLLCSSSLLLQHLQMLLAELGDLGRNHRLDVRQPERTAVEIARSCRSRTCNNVSQLHINSTYVVYKPFF